MPASWAADVLSYVVVKGESYEQPTPSVVGLVPDEEWGGSFFNAFVDLADGAAITSASVAPPGRAPMPIPVTGETHLELERYFSTRADLDAACPNGTYTVNFETTHDGTQTLELPVDGDLYPNLPRVTNLAAARAINALADFTLQWVATGVGPASGMVSVKIEDRMTWETVFATGMPGEPGALPGDATSVVVPAGTLTAGHVYDLNITFVRFAGGNSSYGNGMGVYARSVNTWVRTAGTDATDVAAPWSWGGEPWDGMQDVPRNSAAMARFDEPMAAAIDIAWDGGGIDPSKMSYRWNADGPDPARTRLFISYNGLMPASAGIESRMNPDGSTAMQDLAGNPLPSGFGNRITTAAAPTSLPTDLAWAFVAKNQWFRQTSAAVPATPLACGVGIEGGLNAVQTVPEATLKRAGVPCLYAGAEWGDDGGSLYGELGYVAKADLDAFFPNATNYTLDLATAHDGTKSVALSFGTTDAYPNTPHCANYEALQAVDPAAPATIQWDAFAGAGTNDVVVLRVENEQGHEVVATPMPGQAGVLAGSATSYVLPAGSLGSGRSYPIELYFCKNITRNTTTYAGVPVQSFFVKGTTLTIHTTGTARLPAVAGSVAGGDSFQLALGGERFWDYDLEVSSNMLGWHPWERLSTDGSGQAGFTDTDRAFVSRRFYRFADAAGDDWLQPHVSLQGTVKRRAYNTPVAGAVVGTSLDGTTVTTGADGTFFLQTNTALDDGMDPYELRVSAPGFDPFVENRSWGTRPRGLEIWLGPDVVTIEGHVFSTQGNAPVAGAVVGTSLDGQTTTTDANGRFFLVTTTGVGYGSTPYRITVTKAGYQPFDQQNTWGDHPAGQELHIAPL